MASARGELSLVIAKAGQDVGAISSSVFPILGIVTIATAFMTSYVIKFRSMITISPPSTLDRKNKKFRFGYSLRVPKKSILDSSVLLVIMIELRSALIRISFSFFLLIS
jgi:hypothetical protein